MVTAVFPFEKGAPRLWPGHGTISTFQYILFKKRAHPILKKIITGVDEEYMPDKKATPVEYRIKYVRSLSSPGSNHPCNSVHFRIKHSGHTFFGSKIIKFLKGYGLITSFPSSPVWWGILQGTEETKFPNQPNIPESIISYVELL